MLVITDFRFALALFRPEDETSTGSLGKISLSMLPIWLKRVC